MIEDNTALGSLLADRGVEAARNHRVLGLLADGRPRTPREIVRATAVAHRVVAATLDALGTELEREDGAQGRVRLVRPGGYGRYATALPTDPAAAAVRAHPEAAEELRRLVDAAPRSRTDLDHVAATAETALRRGVWLSERFAMRGRTLLCVGDHDLTSLAALLVCPEAEAVVVDIDERMLDYIGAAADRLGLSVRCHFADLRLGLPPSVADGADVVFTDPPYTPEGVELFVRRGLEGMRDPRRGRVAVAYGASETTPGLVAKTQARLMRMDLVFEAVIPEFHRYTGAEAIGAASDLYVLRPTAKAAPAGSGEDARIYSQGGNAKESSGGPVDSGLLLDADTAVGAWPKDEVGDTARAVSLRAWVAGPVPARTAVLNLTGGWEGLLPRALLASTAATTRAVVGSSAPEVRDAKGQRALRDLLEPGFAVRFWKGRPGPKETVVETCRTAPESPAERLLAHCQHHAHAPLPRALREGLIAAGRDADRPVNKRTARTVVAEHAPWARHHTLLDLPAHRFAALKDAAARMVAAIAQE